MEATIPSSFSRLFYIQFSNTWRWMYTHNKFPRVQHRIAKKGSLANFLASFRKHYLDFLAKLTEKVTVFSDTASCNDQQMALWQHHDSIRESRTKLHQLHMLVTWSTHTTDGFWHVLGSMGFLQLEDENFVNWKYFSVSVFLGFFRSKQGIRIGESLNCD